MKLLLLCITILITGCTHSIHMSHMSGVSENAPKAADIDKYIIDVKSEQTVVLGFAFDTDYVDQAYKDLQKECPSNIVAVNTQYSTSHGFLHWTNKIRMKAVCAP